MVEKQDFWKEKTFELSIFKPTVRAKHVKKESTTSLSNKRRKTSSEIMYIVLQTSVRLNLLKRNHF